MGTVVVHIDKTGEVAVYTDQDEKPKVVLVDRHFPNGEVTVATCSNGTLDDVPEEDQQAVKDLLTEVWG